MESSSRLGAAGRARWLADLAREIDRAQQLAWRVGFVEARSSEALELYVQLEAARIEVETLRKAGSRVRPWTVGEPATCFPESP